MKPIMMLMVSLSSRISTFCHNLSFMLLRVVLLVLLFKLPSSPSVSALFSLPAQEWLSSWELDPSRGRSGSVLVELLSVPTTLEHGLQWIFLDSQRLITTTGWLTTTWSHATDGRADLSLRTSQWCTEHAFRWFTNNSITYLLPTASSFLQSFASTEQSYHQNIFKQEIKSI